MLIAITIFLLNVGVWEKAFNNSKSYQVNFVNVDLKYSPFEFIKINDIIDVTIDSKILIFKYNGVFPSDDKIELNVLEVNNLNNVLELIVQLDKNNPRWLLSSQNNYTNKYYVYFYENDFGEVCLNRIHNGNKEIVQVFSWLPNE